MSSLYRYTVEYEDGHEDEYTTYQDAKTIAQRDSAKVIEYEYEFSDSSMIDDYTDKEVYNALQTGVFREDDPDTL